VARVLGFLLALAASGALTACGGDKLSLDPVAAAAERTQAIESARVSFFGTGDVGGKVFRFTGHGVTHGARTRMQMEIVAGAMRSTSEVVQDGLVMYVRLDALSSQLPESKVWVKLDLRELGEAVGADFEQILATNPGGSLEELLSSTDARKVGTELVRGVPTTHYEVTIANAGEGLSEEFLQNTKPEYEPTHVWIDDEGLVRRLRIAFSVLDGGRRVHPVTTLEMYDFGADVEVELPPDDEVVDAGDLG